MKSEVTISRHWSHPKIHVTVSTEGISLQISIEDFISALIKEIGPVTWVVTSLQFRKRVDEAVIVVLEKMKEESSKVV